MAAGSYQLIWVAQGGTGTVTLASLPQTGATTGQVILWNGSAWAPGTVSSATSFPPAYQLFSGTTAHTIALPSENGVQFQQSGTSGTLTITLPDASGIANFVTSLLNFGSGSSTVTLSIPSTAWLYVPGQSTSLSNTTVSTSDPLAQMSITAVPNTNYYAIETLTGKWVTASGTALINNTPVALSQLAATSATNGQVLTFNGTVYAPATPASAGGSGTVTSVAFADGSTTPIFGTTGSPITSSGTITRTLLSQSAGTVFAVPVAGGAQPSFMQLAVGHLPSASAQTVLRSSGTNGAASGSPVYGQIYAPDMRSPSATSGQVLTATGSVTAPTWQSIPTQSTAIMGASGTSHAAGSAPDPGATAGTTRYLREDATWVTPPAGTSGITGLTGDVTTAAGSSGSTAATVALVGGQTNTAVATAATSVASATSANTVSTLAARDANGAIQMSTGVTVLASSTITVTAAQSGTTFLVNSGSNSVTLIANPAGISYKFKFVGNSGAISVSPPSSGTYYYFGGSTTYAINQTNSNTGDCIEFTGIPGTSNYIVNNAEGCWQAGGSTLNVYTALSYPSTNGYVLTANGSTGNANFAAPPTPTMSAAAYLTLSNKTSAYVVLAADAGKWFTITGATSAVGFTLPAISTLTLGFTVYFLNSIAAATATMRVTPNSADSICMETATTTASTGYIASSTSRQQAQSIGLTAVSANKWYPTYGYSFDWTVN